MTKSTEELKNLVQEVHKLAKPWIGNKRMPANKRGPTTKNVYQPVKSSGDTGIIGMQQELVNLARDVTSQLNIRDVASNDPQKQQEAKGRDAFGVFLTKNYMRNSHVPGVEFDPDPKITDVSQKRPDDPTRMSVVMDTMSRIGSAKNELKADGNWGPRTNAALHNAYAFASGLLDFVDDINRFSPKKLNIQSYNRSYLKNLEGVAQVNPNALTPQEKSQFAPLITQHLKAIQHMYEEIKNKILEHGAFRQFIENKTPFHSYGPMGLPLSQKQLDDLKIRFANGFTVLVGPDNTPTKINVGDLFNAKTLQNWAAHAAPSIKIDLPSVVKQLMDKNPGY